MGRLLHLDIELPNDAGVNAAKALAQTLHGIAPNGFMPSADLLRLVIIPSDADTDAKRTRADDIVETTAGNRYQAGSEPRLSYNFAAKTSEVGVYRILVALQKYQRNLGGAPRTLTIRDYLNPEDADYGQDYTSRSAIITEAKPVSAPFAASGDLTGNTARYIPGGCDVSIEILD